MKLLYKPNEFQCVAVSGGVDSMFLLDFLLKGKHSKTVVHFNHGTEFGEKAYRFVHEYCYSKNLDLIVGFIASSQKSSHESWEEYWRNERYKFFNSINAKIALAHHLDDAVETYLFNCINGKAYTMPSKNGNVVRPLLITKRSFINNWVEKNKVPCMDDPGNFDEKYCRSVIRNKIVPEVLKVNKGIHTVVKNMILESTND